MSDFIVGNDISNFQGQIDWNTYKNNSNFVIIKASEGTGYIDNWFGNNRAQARIAGLPRGFYHFGRPDLGNSPQAEADFFCNLIDGDPIQKGEILALDFEVTYTDAVNWCRQWLNLVSIHFNNIRPLIYLNQSQVKEFDWSSVVNAGYGLWLASYNPDGIGSTGAWPFMAIQQTNSDQQVPGIIGKTDRDIFFGDLAAFTKYGYEPPVPAPNPIPAPPPVVPPESPPLSPPTTTPTPIDYKFYLLKIKTVMSHGWFWQKLSGVRQVLKDSGV